MHPDDGKFLSHPGRLKYDWDGVLKQIDESFRRKHDNTLAESMYNMLLEQIGFERGAYKADLLSIYGSKHRELHELHSKQPEWEVIRAKHWNAFRAEVRCRMRRLDDAEERLGDAFLRAIRPQT
jgi:hypothetical protein